jgi:hypothetical protein
MTELNNFKAGMHSHAGAWERVIPEKIFIIEIFTEMYIGETPILYGRISHFGWD